MKAIFIILSLALALSIQWIADARIPLWGIKFPVFAGAVFFWLWRLDFSGRLILAFLSGIIQDTLSINPWGTNLVLFLLLALGSSLLKSLFRETDSLPTQGVSLGIMLFLFLSLGFLAEILIK